MNTRASLLLTLFLGGLLACTSRDTVTLPNTTKATVIGSAGGEAVSPGGQLRLTFPAGALAADTSITITEIPAGTVVGQVGPTYRLGPEGARTASPVSVAIAVPSARADDTVLIARVSNGQPMPLMTSNFDAAAGTVRATITELTSYTVIAHTPRTSCDASDGGMPFENKRIVPCWITETEPNDTAATAQPTDLPLDEGVDIGAHSDADDDFYSFIVPAGSTGAINGTVHTILGNYGSCEPGLMVEGALLDANGNVLTTGGHQGSCVYFNHYDDPGARDLAPGRYTIRLRRSVGGQSLPYRFALYLLGPGNGTVIIGPDSGI